MRAIAVKKMTVGGRTFKVRIDKYEVIDGGHYVKISWSVKSGDLHDGSSLKLQDGDPILKKANYDFDAKTLKPRVMALELLKLMVTEKDEVVTFGFYDKRGHGTADMLIGDTVFLTV